MKLTASLPVKWMGLEDDWASFWDVRPISSNYVSFRESTFAKKSTIHVSKYASPVDPTGMRHENR